MTSWSQTVKNWRDGRSEFHARWINAEEVLTVMEGEIFIFPVADGTVKISGEDQGLRTSTLTRERPERGEQQEILQGKSDELDSRSQFQDDSTRDDEEAKDDFWTITGEFIYRHHVVPRVKLFVPREETFLHSDEVHRRYQNNENVRKKSCQMH